MKVFKAFLQRLQNLKDKKIVIGGVAYRLVKKGEFVALYEKI